jgi:hypothetical protein
LNKERDRGRVLKNINKCVQRYLAKAGSPVPSGCFAHDSDWDPIIISIPESFRLLIFNFGNYFLDDPHIIRINICHEIGHYLSLKNKQFPFEEPQEFWKLVRFEHVANIIGRKLYGKGAKKRMIQKGLNDIWFDISNYCKADKRVRGILRRRTAIGTINLLLNIIN